MIRRAGWLLLGAASLAAVLAERLTAAAAADEIKLERDIEYSNPENQHLKLNLTQPSNIEGLAPAVICIHGGGWTAGGREDLQIVCDVLARHGFVAATVQYRLAPAWPFPAALEDVQQAVRWIRANAQRLKVDPNRIGTFGGSAGGHLAHCLGVGADVDRLTPAAARGPAGTVDPSCRVQCVVSVCGPTDLTRERRADVFINRLLSQFLGGDIEHARRNYILASPFYWVTPDAAPTLIMHGTADNIVPYEQATLMHGRLHAAGVEVELLSLEGAGHIFVGKNAERSNTAMLDWLDKHLKGQPK